MIEAGAFVAFDPGAGGAVCEGMLPVRRMRGDWYDLNEERTALVGRNSGRTLRLARPGDLVRVRSVEPPRGRIDLELAGWSDAMSRRGHAKAKPRSGDVATNRQARFKYHLLESWETGIALQGSEVKSLRDGNVNLKDSYALVRDGEVWLHNCHIAPYEPAARDGHDPSGRASC